MLVTGLQHSEPCKGNKNESVTTLLTQQFSPYFFLLKLYGDYSSDENAKKRNAVFVFRRHGNDWSKQLACGLTKYLNIRKGKSLSLETPPLLASPQQGSLMCYKLQILIQFNQTIFLSNSAKQHL